MGGAVGQRLRPLLLRATSTTRIQTSVSGIPALIVAASLTICSLPRLERSPCRTSASAPACSPIAQTPIVTGYHSAQSTRTVLARRAEVRVRRRRRRAHGQSRHRQQGPPLLGVPEQPTLRLLRMGRRPVHIHLASRRAPLIWGRAARVDTRQARRERPQAVPLRAVRGAEGDAERGQ